MSVRETVRSFDHPAWLSAAAAVAGYLLLLAIVFVVLFVVPWLALQAV